MPVQYFLGANAPTGFYSLFSHLLPVEEAGTLYILKGGPGCGKSTLMGRLSRRAQDRGEPVEEILCSGDPDSLDGVIFPRRGIALVDGTAPHVFEPRCPGAVDRYMDLGICYDYSALAPLKEDILARKAECASCCTRATRFFRAAAELRADDRALLLTPAVRAKLAKRAGGIAGREFSARKQATPGKITHRFLDALTCQGELRLCETAQALCPRVYLLSDRWGLAHDLLLPLLEEARARGFDAVACHDPRFPERLRHVLVPGGPAFLSGPLPQKTFRRLRLDAMADGEVCRAARTRLRFSEKMAAALEAEGYSALAGFKAAHDALEALYRPHSDFTRADEMAERMEREIFGD